MSEQDYRAALEDVARELNVWALRPNEASPQGLARTIRYWLANPVAMADDMSFVESLRVLGRTCEARRGVGT